jgi:biotin transporter BioY
MIAFDLSLMVAISAGVLPFICCDLLKMALLAGATTHLFRYQ